MPILSLQNKNLFLEISPEMGASVTKFYDRKKNKDIFRPFPKTKKISKKNCYFSGYFATVPYFGVIHKDAFFYKNKFIKLSRTHPLEPDTIHGEGWVKNWKIKTSCIFKNINIINSIVGLLFCRLNANLFLTGV